MDEAVSEAGPPKKKTRPSYGEREKEILLATLRRLLAERFDGVQSRLAEAIGVSKGTVGDYLLGRNGPHPLTAERIAELVGMGLEDLLAGGAPASVNFEPAATFARACGLPDDAIEAVRAEAESLRLSPRDFFTQIEGEAARIQARARGRT